MELFTGVYGVNMIGAGSKSGSGVQTRSRLLNSKVESDEDQPPIPPVRTFSANNSHQPPKSQNTEIDQAAKATLGTIRCALRSIGITRDVLELMSEKELRNEYREYILNSHQSFDDIESDDSSD